MKPATSRLLGLTAVVLVGVACNVQTAWANLVFDKKLIASDANTNDRFGHSVGISERTVIVGASKNDDDGDKSGAAYIYQYNFGGPQNWGEIIKLTAIDAAEGDRFGQSADISGNTAIVGAWRDDDGGDESGSAYIFDRHAGGPNNWGHVKKLTASDAALGDQFSLNSVAIFGDTAVVGANADDDAGSASGSAYIFQRDFGGPNNWGQVKKLTASDEFSNDQFGLAVGIHHDTVIIGAKGNDDGGSGSGSSYIFERDQGGSDNWGEVAILTASDPAEDDNFGTSVTVFEDIAIIGVPLDDDNVFSASGSAYVFSRDSGGVDNWGQVEKLLGSGLESNRKFGSSVSVSDGIAIIGAEGNATAFQYDLTDLNNISEAQLISPDTLDNEWPSSNFGIRVAIDGGIAVVGAHFADVIVNPEDNAGAAYVFVPEPATLSLLAVGVLMVCRRRRALAA